MARSDAGGARCEDPRPSRCTGRARERTEPRARRPTAAAPAHHTLRTPTRRVPTGPVRWTTTIRRSRQARPARIRLRVCAGATSASRAPTSAPEALRRLRPSGLPSATVHRSRWCRSREHLLGPADGSRTFPAADRTRLSACGRIRSPIHTCGRSCGHPSPGVLGSVTTVRRWGSDPRDACTGRTTAPRTGRPDDGPEKHGVSRPSTLDLETLWRDARDEVMRAVTSTAQRQWLEATRPVGYTDDVVVLATPHDFARAWLETRCGELIRTALSEAAGRPLTVVITVQPRPEPVGDLGAAETELAGPPSSTDEESAGPRPRPGPPRTPPSPATRAATTVRRLRACAAIVGRTAPGPHPRRPAARSRRRCAR